MSTLDYLLLLSTLTVVFGFVFGNQRAAGTVATMLYGAQLILLIGMSGLGYGSVALVEAEFSLNLLGQPLHWSMDAMGWLFSVITVGSAFFASWFSAGDWMRQYRETGASPKLLHGALALNVFGMLALLASGDLLSLFIGWEITSWASFLIMAIGTPKAVGYAMRYLVYAISGAMAVLGGMILVYAQTGSFEFATFQQAIPNMSNATLWLLIALFGGGFGIKLALIPFHLWQAKAYAESAGPAAVFLGAISSRMGLFAMVVVLVQIIGLGRLIDMPVPFTFLDARDVFSWIAVLTIILPTYTALQQHDARRLLAWHGIGQGGYMLLGIMTANDLGSAGGLLHVFNYATCQAVLFMAVYSVFYRTGTTDLNRLGGLVTRMPLSFLALLIGIIGLAGLPPMNGFVSKWLVYRSLVIEGSPLLFVGSVIGTLGTILSVYKLIHNIFLGQLRIEHNDVEEVPLSMLLPMMLVSAIIFISGYFPGLILDWVASAQAAIGLTPLAHTLGGVASDKGGLNMIAVVSVLLAGFGIGAILFYSGNRSKRIHQLDNYAGGHFLTADTRYQYSDNFYPGLMHLIGGWYRSSFKWLESSLISVIDTLSLAVQGLYRHAHPSFYLLAVIVFALSWVVI